MIKVTELKERGFRTVHHKDADGKRYSEKVETVRTRKVNTVSSGTRFGHYFIDIILILAVSLPVQFYIAFNNIDPYTGFPLNQTLSELGNVFGLFVYFFYYFLFEMKYQKTPGKFATNTFVINEFGNAPDKSEVFKRTLVRMIPFEPFSCLDSQSYGWHDKFSETFVVTKAEYELLKKMQEEQTREPLQLITPSDAIKRNSIEESNDSEENAPKENI